MYVYLHVNLIFCIRLAACSVPADPIDDQCLQVEKYEVPCPCLTKLIPAEFITLQASSNIRRRPTCASSLLLYGCFLNLQGSRWQNAKLNFN